MLDSTTVFIVGLSALAIGVAIGISLFYFWNPQGRSKRQLEKKLEQAEQDLNAYRDQVTEHFMETSRLVNDLSQSYRNVHEYLANSAMKLTNPSISQQFTRQLDHQAAGSDKLKDLAIPEDGDQEAVHPSAGEQPSPTDKTPEYEDTPS